MADRDDAPGVQPALRRLHPKPVHRVGHVLERARMAGSVLAEGPDLAAGGNLDDDDRARCAGPGEGDVATVRRPGGVVLDGAARREATRVGADTALARIAQLLPALLVTAPATTAIPATLIAVRVDQAERYARPEADDLLRVSEARVPLREGESSRVVLFRDRRDASEHVAASATGTGEYVMRMVGTRALSERIERGAPLAEAVESVLEEMGRAFDADVGLVAVDRHGEVAARHRTRDMPHAWFSGEGPVTARARA